LLRFCKNQLDRADLEVYLGRLTGRTYSLSFRRWLLKSESYRWSILIMIQNWILGHSGSRQEILWWHHSNQYCGNVN